MVYAYLRVSTDKQDENSQRLGVDGFAEKKALTIDKYVIDDGISGAKEFKERKLGELIERLKRGDIVLVSEISRIGRKLILVLDFIRICSERGVMLYSIKDGYRIGDDIQSKVMVTVMGLCAEIERDLIRQRTKEGLARVRASGVTLGRPKGATTDLTKRKLYKKEELIIKELRKGTTQREIAKMCKVNRNTMNRYIKSRKLKERINN